MSYQEFISRLQDREYFGQKLGLGRIQKILSRLGNPEREFRSIHLAGTNGKGSTAAMIASMFKEAGYRVGLYTSPHLVDFCERIQIPPSPLCQRGVQGGFIPQDQVLHYTRIIHEIETEPLTFFELATAIAFLHFAEEKVDIAVIEVGLGGRLDATNVIHPLVSVITTIGYDHMQHLGDTLEKIAFEKAGIIKPGVPVVVGELPEEVMGVVKKVADDCGGGLIRVGSPVVSHLPLSGSHQLHNAAVAVAVIEELKKQGWEISEESIRRGLANVRWPGRLETVQESPWILLDGAHNPQAMSAVRRFLEPRLEGHRLKVLFGAMEDKDITGILFEIAPLADEFVFTAPHLKRAADPQALFQIAAVYGKRSSVVPDVTEALGGVLEGLRREEVLLVTGSLFLVGEARQWFQKNL